MIYKEIEVRFLEIDKKTLIARLKDLGAKDLGEKMLEEVIFYDEALSWQSAHKLMRLRRSGDSTKLAYKHHEGVGIASATEIEVEVSDMQKMEAILAMAGLVAYRHQQKLRHTFNLDSVTVDIDTWPRIPTYVELEGTSESSLKTVAKKLQLDWKDVVYEDARRIIEGKYATPVSDMRWFTFDRFE